MSNVKCQKSNVPKGFTLIELLVTIGVLGVLAFGIWGAWILAIQVINEKRAEVVATSIAIEQIEQAKTLPYESVGTVNGIPQGVIPQTQTITRNGVPYTVKTSILYIDDPFDETAPQDLLPTDYKRVRTEVIWGGKFGVSPVVVMTDIAPKGLETDRGGGTILLHILNAKSESVPGAAISIRNTRVSPEINLQLTSDTQGNLLLPGAPPSQEGYDIAVTKEGYSTDGTTRAEVGVNPSPTTPPLSVFERQLTETNFFIDRLATLTVRTVDNRGSPDWWRSTWPYRKNLTLENTGNTNAQQGTAVVVDLDHRALVQQGKSLANGDDVRIVFWNGTYFEELDRVNTSAWNGDTPTRLWFKIQRAIGEDEESEGQYALYYGNLDASSPPASPGKVFPPPVDTDTIGLWYLDDGKGSTVARDASVYGHDGTLVNLDPETAWVDGTLGTALSFPGSGTPLPHVSVAPTPALANVDTITVEAWIKPTALSGEPVIVGKMSNNKQVGTFNFYQRYGAICLFVWKDVNPYDGRGCGGGLQVNTWNHVAGTFDGQYIRIYVNGELAGTEEKPGVLIKTEWMELNIGKYAMKNWNPFFGEIDTVAYHRVARTDFSYGRPSAVEVRQSTERNYRQPNAIPNVTVTIQGSKVIGHDDEGKPILKFKTTATTDGSGVKTFANQEWDPAYTITINGQTSGYDIAETLPLLPIALPPAGTVTERLTLLAHRDHTLLVTVKNGSDPVDGASVQLTSDTPRYQKTIIAGETGQAFFGPLSADTNYTLVVEKPGYSTITTTVYVHEQTFEDVPLAPQ